MAIKCVIFITIGGHQLFSAFFARFCLAVDDEFLERSAKKWIIAE